MGLKGQAEGVGLCLVDVCIGGANSRRNAMCPYKAWVGGSVMAVRVCDRDTERTEYSCGCSSCIFGVVAAICGPDEG